MASVNPRSHYAVSQTTDPMQALIDSAPEGEVKETTFEHLLKLLLPPHPDKFRGCEVILPDTVVYSKGQPQMLLKMDKAFCLTAVKKNLSPENVARQLNQAYSEMKEDKNGVFSRLYVK